MRFFIAIDLPDSIKKYMRKLQKSLPNADMTLTRDFHLTLKFLGECDAIQRAKVEEALEHVSFQPFEGRLDHIGIFGRKNPRVAWVGIKIPQHIFKIAKKIDEKMEKIGFKSESRFLPHITLARIKHTKNPRQFIDSLLDVSVKSETFKVLSFWLFESKLSSKGAEYIKLKEFFSSADSF